MGTQRNESNKKKYCKMLAIIVTGFRYAKVFNKHLLYKLIY